MYSNRFSALVTDVDAEIANNVEVKLQQKPIIKTPVISSTTYCEPAIGLTKYDIVKASLHSFKNEIQDGESPDEFETRLFLQDCKKRLWMMMLSYQRNVDVFSANVIEPENFTKMFSAASRKFFTRLVYHNEGEWQGEITSVSSWYLGKRANGTPLYVYIGSYRGYGSCSYCDHYQGIEVEFYDVERSKESEEIKRKTLNKLIRDNIGDVFSSLHFFSSWSEARKWVYKINPHTENGIEMPDFEKIKAESRKLAEERRIKTQTSLTDSNFPSLR